MFSQLQALKDADKSIHFRNGKDVIGTLPKTAGYSLVTSEPYTWNGLKRGKSNSILFQHTISGKGKLVYNGRNFDLNPGSSMLLKIPHDHCYYIDDEHWEFFWVSFEGYDIVRLFENLVRDNGPIHYFPNSIINRVSSITHDIITHQFDSIGEASIAAHTFAMTLFDYLNNQSHTSISHTNNHKIRAAINYLDNNFSKDINIKSLSSISGYSYYHFCRLFKRELGLTPHDYLLSKRMNKASFILRQSNLSIKEVSYQCGYSEASYFAKAFRKEFGCSPLEFRNRVFD